MWGTYVSEDREKFDHKIKVGVIVNYFSEQILKRDYELYSLIPINHEKIIKKYNLKTVFIDGDFLTSTNPWKDFRLEDIINQLKKLNVDIYLINNNNLSNMHYNNVKNINFDLNLENNNEDINEITLPLLINEHLINPITQSLEYDILLVKTDGSINSSMDDFDFLDLSTSNYRYVNINKKNTVKLIDEIRKAKIVYIEYSHNYNISVLKYIELFAISLNKLIIFDPLYQYESEFILSIHSDTKIKEYLCNLINKPMLYRMEIIPRNRKALLNHSLITRQKFSDIIKTTQVSYIEPKVGIYIEATNYEYLGEIVTQLDKQRDINLNILINLQTSDISKNELDNLQTKSRFNIKIILNSEAKIENLIKSYFDNCKYFLKLSGEVYISEYYVLDQVLSLEYSQSDLVGKSGHMIYFKTEKVTVLKDWEVVNEFSDSIILNTYITKLEYINNYLHQRKLENFDESLLKRFRKDNKKIYIGNNNGFYIAENSINESISNVNDSIFYCYGEPIDFE